MKINNIYELDNSVELLNKSYIKDKITFYDNKIDKIWFILKSIFIAYFSFLLLIYSEFFSHYFEFQIIFTAFSLFILFGSLFECEYFIKFYSLKKKELYSNIKNNNYKMILEDLFFEDTFIYNKVKLYPFYSVFIYCFFIIIFYFYLYYCVCDSSILSFFNLSLKNILYFYYMLISIIFIIFFVIMFIIISNNIIITKTISFAVFIISFILILFIFLFLHRSAWDLKVDLEKGHLALYHEIAYDIDIKFGRSLARVYIVLEDKNTENYTQHDFSKTIMHAAKEYHNKFLCDITNIILYCQNSGDIIADRVLASIYYIPDKKGINGKGNSSNWEKLLSVKKGYNLSELDYLKIYAENREKYDDELALKNFIEEKLKKSFYRSPLDNEPQLMKLINN